MPVARRYRIAAATPIAGILATMHVLRALCLLLVAALSAAIPVAFAADNAGSYEAVVPVQGQGATERNRAVGEGFRQVLVKVSGQRSVLAMPAVQAEFGRADALLASYRYETVAPRGPGQAPGATLDGPLRLRLFFDASGVTALLNRAAAPVWGPSRPKTYFWILRDAAVGRLPLSAGTAQGDLLLDAATQRGMPVVLPGAEAALPVPGFADPASGVPADVADAAQRAGARAVLAATLGGSPGQVRAVGTLRLEGDAGRVEVAAADEAAALRELVAVVADRLGARYAVVARQDQFRAVRFRVSGVADLAALAALERWLASLPLVKDIVIERQGAEQVDFAVTVAGEAGQFVQSLRVDGRFATLGEPTTDGGVTFVEAALR